MLDTQKTEGAPAGTRSPKLREAGEVLRSDTRTIPHARSGASGFPDTELDALRQARNADAGTPWLLKASAEQLAAVVAYAVRAGLELPAAVVIRCQGLGLPIPEGAAVVRSFPVPGSEVERTSKSVHSPKRRRTGKQRTFARCVYPQHITAASKGTKRLGFLEVRCRRWTCPGCRELLAAEHGGRVLEAFRGESMYRAEVKRGEWEAWRKRANRAGVRFVRAPVSPFAFAVFTTDAVTPDAVEVPERLRLKAVREVLTGRPHYGNRDASPGNLSSSRGFLPPAQPAANPEAELEKAWHRVGAWTPNPQEDTAAQAYAAAEAEGLPAELLDATPALQAGVAVEVDWADSGQVAAAARLLKRLAFVAFDGADDAPLCDAWQDDNRIGYNTGREPVQARLRGVA